MLYCPTWPSSFPGAPLFLTCSPLPPLPPCLFSPACSPLPPDAPVSSPLFSSLLIPTSSYLPPNPALSNPPPRPLTTLAPPSQTPSSPFSLTPFTPLTPPSQLAAQAVVDQIVWGSYWGLWAATVLAVWSLATYMSNVWTHFIYPQAKQHQH